MNEQARINATISYFFLGPLFLLAKSGTPLRDPFVRSHAIRSSIIIGISLMIYLLYAFFLRSFIDFMILGFSLQSILLALLLGATILMLLHGAYQAYHGLSAEYSRGISINHLFSNDTAGIHVENDDDKVRIVASMIPLLGIYVAQKYEHPLTFRGRSLGSLLFFAVLISSVFSSEGGIFVTIIGILSVLIFVVMSVNIFLRGEFIMASMIEKIPSYEECEAHIFASILSIREFMRIAFGGTLREDYHTLYVREIALRGIKIPPTIPYFMPTALIAIPVWNLFSLPSLWIAKYREYRNFIFSGIFITLIMSSIMYFDGSSSPYLPFFLFPIIHILVYASSDLSAYIPGIHILLRILGIAKIASIRIHEDTLQKKDAHYVYNIEEK